MPKRPYFLAPITMAAPISSSQRRQRLQDGPRSVRIVKDVLRVGHWRTGEESAGASEFWNVTPAVLADLTRNFDLARSRGFRPTLQVTHNPQSDDDLLAYVDEMKVLGDRLFVAALVTPAQAKYLRSPVMKVSVRADRDWQDPKGHRYSVITTHVAVTDRPCVSGQESFRALSSGWPMCPPRTAVSARLFAQPVPTKAVALSSRAPAAPSSQAQFEDRLRRAEELAKRRGISVAAAMSFIPR